MITNLLKVFLPALVVIGMGLPVAVSAQNRGDLCGGANLSFDESARGCEKVACDPGSSGCSDAGFRNRDADAGEATNQGKINNLITNILNVLSVIVGIIAVIMIIIGGFKFITAGGDAGRVTSARNTVLYALVGLIIVALAQVIVRFVLSKATGAPTP